MGPNYRIALVCMFLFGLQVLFATEDSESCDVTSHDCVCTMPKLYDCPEVNLVLGTVPDAYGCQLIEDALQDEEYSNVTCGPNETISISHNVEYSSDPYGNYLRFSNENCKDDFYFIADLNGGRLVKKMILEYENWDMSDVYFEFAFGYTVPCNDQPTVNTLLWQYITPHNYEPNANITEVWNRLNFTDDGTYLHIEESYFKAAYLFIHFSKVPPNATFKLSLTGCQEDAKDIDPSLEYLNNLLGATNDTANVTSAIIVSYEALPDDHELTDDETVLFIDALQVVGEGEIDFSDDPETAQNATDGLVGVATSVLASVGQTPEIEDTANVTDASAAAAAEEQAALQSEVVNVIEAAIGTVTAQAGNATITSKSDEIIVVSQPVTVSLDLGLETIDMSLANEGGVPNDDDGITVELKVDLGAVIGNIDPDATVRVTAIQINAEEFGGTTQQLSITKPDATDAETSGDKNKNIKQISSYLNSDIVSVTMYVNGHKESVPTVLDFVNKERYENLFENSTYSQKRMGVCAWLNDTEYTDHGCEAANETHNGTQTHCTCSHTTSFAVLMQVVEFDIHPTNTLIMTILTYFGISLSIFCLVVALFIFFSVQALRVSERNMIHRNLMIALLIAYITFIGGVEQATKIPIVCTMVAAIMQYLYLCVFAWMLIEGIHLYFMLVKVFGSEGSKKPYYMAIGWISPILIVAISVGVRYEDYGTPTYCWIKPGSPAIWAFVGPVIAIILFNMFVLLKVMHIIYRSSAISVDCPVDQIRAAAKGSLGLLPLLGITWVLGVFCINGETLIFQYLFVICNSTQGILLFVFHVLFNSEVRNALRREQEKMGWSTAGTSQSKPNRSRIHPDSDGQSTTKSGFVSPNDDEKALVISTQIKVTCHGNVPTNLTKLPKKKELKWRKWRRGSDEKKEKSAPGKGEGDYSLPGQIDDPIDEADTSTIRQEIKTEREMQKGGWKINEEKHVKRTFVRVEEPK